MRSGLVTLYLEISYQYCECKNDLDHVSLSHACELLFTGANLVGAILSTPGSPQRRGMGGERTLKQKVVDGAYNLFLRRDIWRGSLQVGLL